MEFSEPTVLISFNENSPECLSELEAERYILGQVDHKGVRREHIQKLSLG
jgi:hypothetical protein